jgi:hypothetical protein
MNCISIFGCHNYLSTLVIDLQMFEQLCCDFVACAVFVISCGRALCKVGHGVCIPACHIRFLFLQYQNLPYIGVCHFRNTILVSTSLSQVGKVELMNLHYYLINSLLLQVRKPTTMKLQNTSKNLLFVFVLCITHAKSRTIVVLTRPFHSFKQCPSLFHI